MHPTIQRMTELAKSLDEEALSALLAENVAFLPPTYWATWQGAEPVAAILGHVSAIFEDFQYRRVMGQDADWALEFECRIGDLNAVGVDLITLDAKGKIAKFEVVMRPHKTVGVLRTEMMRRIKRDARFLKFQEQLTGKKPPKRNLLARLLGH